MDPITNSLAAFALSRTGLGRLSRRGEAALILGASLPDLDYLSALFSPVNLFSFVGGPFHALLAAPLLAAGLAALIRLNSRRPIAFARMWLLSLAGIALRLALDLLGVDGVQLLYPFDRAWFHLDILPWFDPWLFLLLLGYAFWPWISHLVNLEMGIRQATGKGIAFVVILLAAGYVGYRAANHAEAISVIANFSYAGNVPLREACFPDVYSLVRVRCVVETDSHFANIDYFVGENFDATEAQLLKRQNQPVWQVAQFQSAWYQQLSNRLRMPYWTVFPADFPTGAREAVMQDLVLAPEPYPRFRLRILLDSRERLLEETLVVNTLGFDHFESTLRR
ncbi:MAG: metal-dependent hydrolase [Bryobacterales bacterium]|nr:metal-dependent hydrolase [Bryobacterales bacterium]